MKRLSPVLKVVLALCLLAVLAAVGVIAFLQSSWISQRIRQAVIDGVEDATGAHAEIPNFIWNWRTLTVEMRGFKMHGFEPRSGPPLFTSPVIRARLRILSLLDRNVQLSSLVVTRPRFYLMIEPDGKTNIPGPKHIVSPREIINTLVDLRLPHVEAIEGWAQINTRSFPVSLEGDHVSLLIRFQGAARRYQMVLRSPALRLGDHRGTYFDGSVEAGGELWRDHFALTPSRFHSRSADLTVSGSLYEFNNPVIDWRLASTFATTETMRKFGIKDVQGGSIKLDGIGHHDPQTALFFDGKLTAEHLSVAAPSSAQSGLRLREAALSSRFVLDTASLKLSDLLLTSAEGRFAGSATLAAYQDFQLSGTLSGISLQPLASKAIQKPFPWSATVGGPVSLTAKLEPTLQNVESRGDLTFEPAPGGIPVSGNVRYRYQQSQTNQRSQVNQRSQINLEQANIVIEESHLNLPNTQLTISGQPNADVSFALDSTNLSDLNPGLSLAGMTVASLDVPSLERGGSVHLRGAAHLQTPQAGTGNRTEVDGTLDASDVEWKGTSIDRIRAAFHVSPSQLRIPSLSIEAPLLQSMGSLQVTLTQWRPNLSAPLQAAGSFTRARVQSLLKLADPAAAKQLLGGFASGSFHLRGTAAAPEGDAQVKVTDLNVFGEHLESAAANFEFAKNCVTVSQGQLQSGTAMLGYSGSYTYGDSPSKRGTLQVTTDTNRFPLSRLHTLGPALNPLEGETEVHLRTALAIDGGHIAPLNLSGTASLHRLLYRGVLVGDLDASARTDGVTVRTELTGNIRGSRLAGAADLEIAPGTPITGSLAFGKVDLNTVIAILQPAQQASALLSGSANGKLVFNGPLETPSRLHATLQLRDLQITGPPLRTLGAPQRMLEAAAPLRTQEKGVTQPSESIQPPNELILQSSAPVTLDLTDGLASIRSAEFTGRDTRLSISGTAGLLGAQPLRLALNGGVDLRLLQLLYPDLQIGGQSTINASVSGTLPDPQLSGTVQLVDGRVFSTLAPNGLSNLGGTIRFDQHRATLENVTAHTGGGLVTFGGFVTYTANHPLVYRLDSTGQNIRVRYANGISITGNTQFSLTGTSEQSLLSGGITVSRVVLNPSTDLGNLLALTSAPTVASDNSKDYLSRLQMDIHVESAPNLQLDTALSSNVQTDLDLQLRGTPKQPVILGRIEANQGDIKVFGSRYTINRGQISFTNAARLEPVLDLDLQTQARGITVDITVSGTLNKLNINYRSDPPLQPRDIIALLTVGRTPQSTAGESNVSATNDANSLQSGANSVLGQAIAPVSNRLSKLFGITNIKIDPLVQGITNTPQARLTLEQQISRQITVTYITNLSQSSEQIFRLEYALNPQFSLIALRDDNGEFGIDILYKKRFK